jgi:hypothetical protein
MSPPWGGPDYAKVDIYDMEGMLKPCDGLVPCFYSLKRVVFYPSQRVHVPIAFRETYICCYKC